MAWIKPVKPVYPVKSLDLAQTLVEATNSGHLRHILLKLNSKLILTAGRVMKKNKNKVVNYVCPHISVCNTNFQRGLSGTIKEK